MHLWVSAWPTQCIVSLYSISKEIGKSFKFYATWPCMFWCQNQHCDHAVASLKWMKRLWVLTQYCQSKGRLEPLQKEFRATHTSSVSMQIITDWQLCQLVSILQHQCALILQRSCNFLSHFLPELAHPGCSYWTTSTLCMSKVLYDSQQPRHGR